MVLTSRGGSWRGWDKQLPLGQLNQEKDVGEGWRVCRLPNTPSLPFTDEVEVTSASGSSGKHVEVKTTILNCFYFYLSSNLKWKTDDDKSVLCQEHLHFIDAVRSDTWASLVAERWEMIAILSPQSRNQLRGIAADSWISQTQSDSSSPPSQQTAGRLCGRFQIARLLLAGDADQIEPGPPAGSSLSSAKNQDQSTSLRWWPLTGSWWISCSKLKMSHCSKWKSSWALFKSDGGTKLN